MDKEERKAFVKILKTYENLMAQGKLTRTDCHKDVWNCVARGLVTDTEAWQIIDNIGQSPIWE